MTRLGNRLRAGASVFACAALLAAALLAGCAGLSSSADVDLTVGRHSTDNAPVETAPRSPLQIIDVELHIFAENGQNPVTFTYTVTNIHDKPILAPILVVFYNTSDTSPHLQLIKGDPVTQIAEGLKVKESVTGSLVVQVEPMEWEESAGINVMTPLARENIEHGWRRVNGEPLPLQGFPEEQEAARQGGTVFAAWGAGAFFRTKDGRIEISRVGWAESRHPGYTTLDDGTRVLNPTVDYSRVMPTVPTVKPIVEEATTQP